MAQSQGLSRYRVGVDIGGTFTDLILVDPDGRITARKVPSTPGNYSQAVLGGLDQVLSGRMEGVPGYEALLEVVHGTTVATNAILESRGARTALITTRGFRDVLELRRLRVPQLYNLQWEKPAPLVPRYLRFEVDERVTHDGEILTPLDPAQVRQLLPQLRDEGVESIAVCLLNAYANPHHEREIGAVLADLLPTVPVSLSTEIIREIGEFERTSTTVTNAYVKPVVARYLGALEQELTRRGFGGRLLVMQSNGAVMTVEAARERPCYLIESGPAAGAIAGRTLAQNLDCDRVITLDMGGTTAKASMVERGDIAFVDEYEIGGGFTVGSRLMKGDGYLLRIPAIDLAEISAGGGSIAWIDSGGALQVGPRSAGAEPGPACYDLGNDEPTITDANLVLGYINPDYFAGGALRLNEQRAWVAIEHLGNELAMDPLETAYAVHVLGNARMARAIRAVSTERGRDVREFTLIACGGSGPIHAAGVARSLGIGKIVIPPYPGLFSALGLIFAEAGHQFVRTYKVRLDALEVSALVATIEEMKHSARDELAELDYPVEQLEYSVDADLRYVGQFFRVRVPVQVELSGEFDHVGRRIAAAFEAEHERRYGHRVEGEPIEMVSLQLTAREPNGSVSHSFAGADEVRERSGSGEDTRQALFSHKTGMTETAITSRLDLTQPGHGPLLIEEFDTTIVVPPGAEARLDLQGNIILELECADA